MAAVEKAANWAEPSDVTCPVVSTEASADVSPALVFYHFGTKDDLVVEAFAFEVERGLRRILERREIERGDPEEVAGGREATPGVDGGDPELVTPRQLEHGRARAAGLVLEADRTLLVLVMRVLGDRAHDRGRTPG